MKTPTCNVIEQHCLGKTSKECFACGLPVCSNCSVKALYYSYGEKRVCFTCCEQHGKGTKSQINAELPDLAEVKRYANSGFTVSVEWIRAVRDAGCIVGIRQPKKGMSLEQDILEMRHEREREDLYSRQQGESDALLGRHKAQIARLNKKQAASAS